MIFRNAQGLTLGLGRVAASATPALGATLENSCLLQDLILQSTQLGLVTVIKAGGQSMMCSNQGADIRMFAPEAQVEGHRAIGVPLAQKLGVEIQAELAAAGTTLGGVNVLPIDPSMVVPVNELGPAMNYVFGMGTVSVGIGLDGVLSAQSRRDGMLGLMVMTPTSSSEDVSVRSIEVNNIELMAGPSGATSECGISQYAAECTDDDGCVVAYPIRQNDSVDITLHNYNAAAIVCYGGIYMMPAAMFNEE